MSPELAVAAGVMDGDLMTKSVWPRVLLRPYLADIYYLLELQTKVPEYNVQFSQSRRRPLLGHLTYDSYNWKPVCVLNVKVLVGAFTQEKALVGTFSMILKSSRTFV